MTSRISRLRTSLRSCTLDGTLHASMVGFGESYFAAFALFLGASPFQVGLLTTLPVLAGAGFQLLAPFGGGLAGSQAWVVGSAFLQALTFVPIALLARGDAPQFHWLLVWVCFYWMLALGINPVWNAWMGRMIPPRIRSRFFGRRNLPIQAALFLSVMGGGLLIHYAQQRVGQVALGFVATFALAASSRVASAWELTRQHDPGAGVPRLHPPFRAILGGARGQPYRQLIILLVLMTGSVNVSAAYFTPFMLGNLELSYAQFSLLNATIVVARALASPYWGEIARTFGNRRALQVAVVLLVPLSGLWVVSSDFTYLMILQLLAGFAWAGFELTTILNFFDCTDDDNRAQVLSLYNLLNGFAIVVGCLLGGAVLHALGNGGYVWLFLGSSMLRLVTISFFARGVGVRRAVEHSFSNVFSRVITLRPGQGPGLRPVVLPESDTGDRASSEEVAP